MEKEIHYNLIFLWVLNWYTLLFAQNTLQNDIEKEFNMTSCNRNTCEFLKTSCINLEFKQNNTKVANIWLWWSYFDFSDLCSSMIIKDLIVITLIVSSRDSSQKNLSWNPSLGGKVMSLVLFLVTS
jgi:hypothetical protein